MKSIKSNLIITTPIFIGMFIGTYILYTSYNYINYKFNISKFNIRIE